MFTRERMHALKCRWILFYFSVFWVCCIELGHHSRCSVECNVFKSLVLKVCAFFILNWFFNLFFKMTFGHNQWLTPNQHVEWLCCESWFKIKFTVLDFRLYVIYLFLNWCRLVHKGGHSFSYNYGYSVTCAVWDWVMFNQHLVLEHCQNQKGSTNKTEIYWGELFASYSALVPNHWGRALEQSPCSAQVCSLLAGLRLLMQEIIKSCSLSKQIWGPVKIQVVHRATGLIMTTASFQVNAQH